MPNFPLFFVDKVVAGKTVISDEEQLHHLRDVLRLKVDDYVDLADVMENDYTGIITSVGKKQAEIKITAQWKKREGKVKIAVACAIPKGSWFHDIIDYLTQLGVERIIPMQTERTVVRLYAARAKEKHARWLKIARSAAQQCHRSRVPVIDPVTGFTDVISRSGDYDLKLIPTLSDELRTHTLAKYDDFDEREVVYNLRERKLIKEILSEYQPHNILVLIGPEGDFTLEEVALALSKGFIPVSLGDTVLRVATAAIAVASYIKFAVNS